MLRSFMATMGHLDETRRMFLSFSIWFPIQGNFGVLLRWTLRLDWGAFSESKAKTIVFEKSEFLSHLGK